MLALVQMKPAAYCWCFNIEYNKLSSCGVCSPDRNHSTALLFVKY